MATYLIDYENVKHQGLAGIEELSSDDCAVLFFGKENTKTTVESAKAIRETKATVSFEQTDRTGKNYLDIQIVCYLCSLICEGKESVFHIISQDKDFISAIDFWKTKKEGISIILHETISGKPIDEIK